MTKNQKISIVQTELLKWFETNQRKFPWRKKSMNSYRYIIAEVLLQRTKAETIAKFYPKFISRYPNWKAIDSGTQRTLSNFLKPIGLYKQRSGRLKKLAHEMVLRKGKIPLEKSELEEIPFFGQYIVNAATLFILKKPAPLLDVNMARVIERIFGKRKLADIRYDPNLQILANELTNHPNSKELNWSVLDYASLVCSSQPKCSICGLSYICTFFKHYK